jgi:GT2 family glycosyltransferase
VNPVLILTHNNLELTKRCVESVRGQDIDAFPFFFDNGSSDGTKDWIKQSTCGFISCSHNEGVSAGWNAGLERLFHDGAQHVLCIGNDTMIPPSFYRTLLSVVFPFVTGVAVDNMEQAFQPPCVFPLSDNPDFSAFLIRREAWEKIGPFDQRMVNYCGDCDYHIRGHRLKVGMVKSSTPFYHERSSTTNLAPPEEQARLHWQANLDRAMFFKIHGCIPGTPEYEALFI